MIILGIILVSAGAAMLFTVKCIYSDKQFLDTVKPSKQCCIK